MRMDEGQILSLFPGLESGEALTTTPEQALNRIALALEQLALGQQQVVREMRRLHDPLVAAANALHDLADEEKGLPYQLADLSKLLNDVAQAAAEMSENHRLRGV